MRGVHGGRGMGGRDGGSGMKGVGMGEVGGHGGSGIRGWAWGKRDKG